MKKLEKLKEPAGEQTTLFSLAGSRDHVNRTVKLESDLAKKMTDTSGRRCLESFGRFSRVGSWAKTYSALLIGMTGWYSTKCKLTWKLKGTKSSRMYFQLWPSTHRTDVTEFGLLPTPRAMDGMAEGINSGKTPQLINGVFSNVRNKDGMRFGSSLNDLARTSLLPTPTAMDLTNATATMKSSQVKEGSMHSVTLSRAILSKEQQETGQTSQLNPRFVCEMMGFPVYYTDI